MTSREAFTIVVRNQDAGKRMDAFVASLIPECSRTFAADLILRGEIRIRGNPKKPAYRLRPGDEISGRVPRPEPLSFEPEPVELDILHEDGHLIVINKQPGLVVHPAPGHGSGTLVNGLLWHCPDLGGIGGKLRPGIVHRLDKDTSGTLVVAKNALAQEHLSAQFKQRKIGKTYLALVDGEPKEPSGTILLPIGRHPVHRKKMSTFTKKGREAETRWIVRERFRGATLLEVELKTGRTHQIRVHCAAMNHPIVGDDIYGGRKAGRSLSGKSPSRQMLHAWRLGFEHPATGERMRFESPVPQDMDEFMAHLRGHT